MGAKKAADGMKIELKMKDLMVRRDHCTSSFRPFGVTPHHRGFWLQICFARESGQVPSTLNSIGGGSVQSHNSGHSWRFG